MMNHEAIIGIVVGSVRSLALLGGLAFLVIGTIMKTRFGIKWS